MQTLQVYRGVKIFDQATIAGQATIDPATGYLTAPVNATKAGIFIYHDEFGREVKCLRPEEEVFKAESMATLARKPATFNHPEHLPTAADIKKYVVGSTGDKAEREMEFLRTSVTVFDKAAIDAIQRGNDEVSCGYEADVTREPGTHHIFGPYELIQRNIVYNHLAVGIEKGRGGPDVRMLLDSADSKKGETMKKIKLGDKEFEVPEDLYDAITKNKAEMDSKLEAAAKKDTKDPMDDAVKKDTDELAEAAVKDDDDIKDDDGKKETKMDAVKPRTIQGHSIKRHISHLRGLLQAAKVSSKAVMDAAPEKLAELAKQHAMLVAVGMTVMDKADPKELFKLTADELKKKVIAAKLPKVVLDGKDQGFIDGLYEGIALQASPSNVGELLGKVLMDTKDAPAGPGESKGERKRWEPKPLAMSNRSAA